MRRQTRYRKAHDRLVQRVCKRLDAVDPDLGKVVFKKEFPELLKEGRETIDLIIVGEKEEVYQILAIEVKAGLRQAASGYNQ